MNAPEPITVKVTAQTDYTIDVTMPAGEPITITRDDTDLLITSLRATVSVDETNTLKTVGTFYRAEAKVIRDNKPTGRSRLVQGSNFTHLPFLVRLVIQEALREQAGTIHDPNDQLNGITAPVRIDQ